MTLPEITESELISEIERLRVGIREKKAGEVYLTDAQYQAIASARDGCPKLSWPQVSEWWNGHEGWIKLGHSGVRSRYNKETARRNG